MSLAKHIPNIHPQGIPWILSFAAVSFLFGSLWEPMGWIGLVLTLWCTYFFRDPDRVTPEGDHWVVSPADGVVSMITFAPPPPELELGEEPLTRVSIFLNVFNVHVNRVPCSGKITHLHYHPGKFFNAELDKASVHNERQNVVMEAKDGRQIVFVQIAGLIARRIKCYLNEEQEVTGGERFGIIRFGSRMDVYLPNGVNPLVVEGQIAVAGETILADLQDDEAQRTGIKH